MGFIGVLFEIGIWAFIISTILKMKKRKDAGVKSDPSLAAKETFEDFKRGAKRAQTMVRRSRNHASAVPNEDGHTHDFSYQTASAVPNEDGHTHDFSYQTASAVPNEDGHTHDYSYQTASAKPNKPRKQGAFFGGFMKKEQSDAEIYNASQKKTASDPFAGRRSGRETYRKARDKGSQIFNKVEQHIYGTDADTADVMVYKNYLEVERQEDIRKIARDLGCTMYQVIREIKDLQKKGYFTNLEIDDSEYKIRYLSGVKDGYMHAGSYGDKEWDERLDSYFAGTDGSRGKNSSGALKKADVKTEAGTQKKETEGSYSKMPGYMTMPAYGNEIGYMTQTDDYTVSYMTMPEGGNEITYNTMP